MFGRTLRTLGTLPAGLRFYLVADALSAFATGGFDAAYNLYVVALGYSAAFLGQILATGMAGAGVGALPAGRLVDRFGPRAVLLVSSVVAAAGIGAQLVLPTAPVLLAGSAVTGAGAAAFFVAAAPFVARNAGAATLTDVFSLDAVTVLAGTAAGAALCGQVASALIGSHFGGPASQAYRATLLLAGGVGACSFPALLLARETPAAVGDAPGLGAWAAEVRPGTLGVPGGWRAALADPIVVRLTVVSAMVGLGAGLFLPYVNVLFVSQLGASPAVYGWVNAGGLVTRMMATLAAPSLAARVGLVATIAGTRLISIPFLLALGFTGNFGLAGGAFLLRGALMDMSAPALAGYTMRELPPQLRGTGNSAIWLAGMVGRGISTLGGGALIAASGFHLPYALAAGVYVTSTLLFVFWFGGRVKPRV